MMIHISASIEGLLRNFSKPGSLEGILTDGKTGRHISDAEARAYLNNCLEKGWKLLPAEGCDNFDYQTGCKGHPSKETTNNLDSP